MSLDDITKRGGAEAGSAADPVAGDNVAGDNVAGDTVAEQAAGTVGAGEADGAGDPAVVAGIDVGTECVKVVILDRDATIIGRSVVQVRGGFVPSSHIALGQALFDGQLERRHLAAVWGTGFGVGVVPKVSGAIAEARCHAAGAHYHFAQAMSVIDIGGREPRLIQVDAQGRPQAVYTVRRCAAGIGSFLMQVARYLDVHPSHLQELASDAEVAARIGSFCSGLAMSDVQERMREGISRQEIALGCLRSVAERIIEIEGLQAPIRITGGVAEYFPGVLWALSELTGLEVVAVPEPVLAGALGAALLGLRAGPAA